MAFSHLDKQTAVDVGTIGGVFSMPLWAQNLEGWLQLFVYIGGAVLLILRFWAFFFRDTKTKHIVETVSGDE